MAVLLVMSPLCVAQSSEPGKHFVKRKDEIPPTARWSPYTHMCVCVLNILSGLYNYLTKHNCMAVV